LVDQKGECREQLFFRTQEFENFDDFLDQIKDGVEELKGKFDFPVNFIGCGIGASNASSRNGTIKNAANLKWKGSVPVLEKLGQRRDLPMRIMNDASAAALGEMLFGNAKGMSDFIVIALGTGFGAGIVANGKLIQGYDGFAGELGHVDMTLGDGRLTGLGIRGGLEAYLSATGLKRTILYMLSKYREESRFRDIALHGEDITKAAEDGDPIALKTFEYTADFMALALANFTAFSQPEAFFLTGGAWSIGVNG